MKIAFCLHGRLGRLKGKITEGQPLDDLNVPVEKVFLPDENVGILIYAPDGLDNLVTNTYLTVTENVFSDSFQLLDDNGGVVATASSSFDALLLLDDDGSDSEDKSDNIINSDDVEYNNIGYWLDVDQDGMYTAGDQIVSLASRSAIIDLTNLSISNTVIDGGADGNYEGIIHRSATITLDSQAYDAYENVKGTSQSSHQNPFDQINAYKAYGYG